MTTDRTAIDPMMEHHRNLADQVADRMLGVLLAGQPVAIHSWESVDWRPSHDAPGMLAAFFDGVEVAWLDDSGNLCVVDPDGNVIPTGITVEVGA